MRSSRRLPAVPAALLAAALVAAPARRARADSMDALIPALVIGGFAGAVYLGSSATFTVHDVATYGTRPPDRGWGIAESAVATPFALVIDGVLAKMTYDGPPPGNELLVAAGVLGGAWSGALSAHGIWGLATPQSDTALRMGGAWAVGANLAFTAGALGGAAGKHLPGVVFGALEVAGTAPTVAVGAYELASPGRPYKPAFAGLVAWSGTLFAHGVASMVVGIRGRRSEGEQGTSLGESRAPKTPALPFALAPAVIAGGPALARALVVSGAF